MLICCLLLCILNGSPLTNETYFFLKKVSSFVPCRLNLIERGKTWSQLCSYTARRGGGNEHSEAMYSSCSSYTLLCWVWNFVSGKSHLKLRIVSIFKLVARCKMFLRIDPSKNISSSSLKYSDYPNTGRPKFGEVQNSDF